MQAIYEYGYLGKYAWQDGKLYMLVGDQYLEYPPVGVRLLILEQYHHELVHIGSDKLYARIGEEYYWPELKKDCLQYVASCISCQLQQAKFRKLPNLQMTYVGARPRQVYSIDLIPDIVPVTESGNNQVCVVVDNFSRFVIVGALPNRQSETVANWFYNQICCIYGKPKVIKSN